MKSKLTYEQIRKIIVNSEYYIQYIELEGIPSCSIVIYRSNTMFELMLVGNTLYIEVKFDKVRQIYIPLTQEQTNDFIELVKQLNDNFVNPIERPLMCILEDIIYEEEARNEEKRNNLIGVKEPKKESIIKKIANCLGINIYDE